MGGVHIPERRSVTVGQAIAAIVALAITLGVLVGLAAAFADPTPLATIPELASCPTCYDDDPGCAWPLEADPAAAYEAEGEW